MQDLRSVLFELSNSIDAKRKDVLAELADLILDQIETHQVAKVQFICTHNSRRSQISELMFRFMLRIHPHINVLISSGGTEETALHENCIHAFNKAGFITEGEDKPNTRWHIYREEWTDKGPLMFSKKYDHPDNPQSEFIAVMVCSDADTNCPFIPNAKRFSLTYSDPKQYDNSPQVEQGYMEKLIEIGSEMAHLTSVLTAEFQRRRSYDR